MKFKIRKAIPKSYDELFNSLSDFEENEENKLDFLIELINHIRPEETTLEARITIIPLIEYLQENVVQRTKFKKYLQQLFSNRRFTFILSDTGIIKDTHFVSEISDRIVAKFLPDHTDKDSLEYVLNQVLYKKTDYIWIETIPFTELLEFHSTLELNNIYSTLEENTPLTEVLNAMSLIIQRASGRFLERKVLQMIPEYENIESPFEAFEKELDIIHKKIHSDENHHIKPLDTNYKAIQILYAECHSLIERGFDNSSEFGMSLRVNQSLLRIQQQLNRLGILLPLLVVEKESDKVKNSLRLVLKLIKYNCEKNNVRKLIGESTQTISYEITQHTAKTGEHYITQTKKEYFNMLFTAMGGGLIVGFMCVFKILMSESEMSDFGHAFLYSVNYSLGFIVIYLLGFTLATKQPAMTAAAIIRSIESGMSRSANEKDRHIAFAKLFAQLFRSQFIAFVGNVIVAFPVALGIVWLSVYLFDFNPAEHEADKLLKDLSPVHSAAIFHAAIAGIFLFLSGIISGSISNRNKHKRIFHRLSEHPVLKKTFGKRNTLAFAEWIKDKWPGVASNMWFGIFMGSTGVIGIFLGLNLNVRHITFASGNFALGLFGKGFNVSNWTLFWSIFGIGIIGFVNFIVSFMLSLGIAFRSRNIQTAEIRYLFRSVLHHFKHKPISFFLPISSNIYQDEKEFKVSHMDKKDEYRVPIEEGELDEELE